MNPQPKNKPYRSEKLKAFTRKQKCVVPGCCGCGDAHHENVIGSGTMGGKCSDTMLIPMCRQHHMERHQIGAIFFEKHNIDQKVEIIRNLTRYMIEKGKK